MIAKQVILLIFYFLSPQSENSRLHWAKNRKLLYTDFKAKFPTDTKYFGAVSSDIAWQYHLLKNGDLEYNIFAFVDRNNSWLRAKSRHVLAHEQGHFDIQEVFSRKMRGYLSNLHLSEFNQAQIDSAILSIHHDKVLTDSSYDSETQHGADTIRQYNWHVMLEMRLDSLKSFSAERGKVHLSR